VNPGKVSSVVARRILDQWLSAVLDGPAEEPPPDAGACMRAGDHSFPTSSGEEAECAACGEREGAPGSVYGGVRVSCVCVCVCVCLFVCVRVFEFAHGVWYVLVV
jgi:hypothetical protein